MANVVLTNLYVTGLVPLAYKIMWIEMAYHPNKKIENAVRAQFLGSPKIVLREILNHLICLISI